ncbi:MAG: hypoxanthine phosphoribosyltransferase [Ruminococcaceae bacterium]|nr:hypoxanthine phosphoribosyltransferase [Oscillospiraceae bacterium]
MEENIQEILLTEAQIQKRINELGKILSEDYRDKNPIIIGVLKGVVVFYADMIRRLNIPCQMEFMWISSYEGTDSTGSVIIKQDIAADIEGRHVLVLEDIFDTGNSLTFVHKHLMDKKPASLKICTLLDKPSRRKPGVTLEADYVGFTIPNAFVVGYGLDYNEYYRNLPYVGILKPEAYT